jgi:hypothetical protein
LEKSTILKEYPGFKRQDILTCIWLYRRLSNQNENTLQLLIERLLDKTHCCNSRQTRLKKVTSGSDLPILLVSLFNRHDFIDQYHFEIDVVEEGIFQRYMHPPTGFAGMESLDIPCRIRML